MNHAQMGFGSSSCFAADFDESASPRLICCLSASISLSLLSLSSAHCLPFDHISAIQMFSARLCCAIVSSSCIASSTACRGAASSNEESVILDLCRAVSCERCLAAGDTRGGLREREANPVWRAEGRETAVCRWVWVTCPLWLCSA